MNSRGVCVILMQTGEGRDELNIFILLTSHQHLLDKKSVQCRQWKQRYKFVQTNAELDIGGTETQICPSWVMSHRCIINVTYTNLLSWEKLLYCWGMGIVPLTAFGFSQYWE